MARRSRRESIPDPEDYLPEEDEFEEEEEKPRRRKKRARDEDEDDAPRRRKRRSRDDEDDDDTSDDEDDDTSDDDESEDEPPRRRKKRSRDDEEDEAPRRRKKRSRDDDDDDDSDDEDDDTDDEPRGRKGKKKRGSNRNSGWGGYQTVKSKSSNYADKLSVGKIKGEVLVKFLDAAPFDSYGLHWFDSLDGKKGWMCLESVGEDKCPGCDLGDRPMAKALFNVLVFDEDGDPNVKVLDAGTRLAGQLEKLAESTKGGLTRDYWSVAAGPKGSGTANFQRVKERDLEEDWDVEPLDDDELAELEEDRHVLADVEQIPSYKDFKDAVRDIVD